MANEYFWGQKKDGTWGLGGDATEFQPGSITGAAGNYGQNGEQQAFGEIGLDPTKIKFGASDLTPNSKAFQGVYKGVLTDSGKEGWSTDPAAFKAGTVKDAVWGDGKTLNAGGAMAPDDSLLGLSPDQWGSAMKAGQIGLGVGQLGLGILGYFQNKGLVDKQKQVLGQQIESNRAEIDARKNYRDALSKF